jgi:hypothetical protein
MRRKHRLKLDILGLCNGSSDMPSKTKSTNKIQINRPPSNVKLHKLYTKVRKTPTRLEGYIYRSST